MNRVGVIMGSDSDYKVMEDALKVLREFEIDFEAKISSAHRTLERTVAWVKAFEAQGGKIIIAAAGLAAHLPGVIAGATTLPVIGVPLSSGSLQGIDALLLWEQCQLRLDCVGRRHSETTRPTTRSG